MSGGPIFNAFTKMASLTVRGATVTFGSTILSCVAACKIEQSANRMIYKYFPHKFANVESANGLTQEQLDAVRVYRDDMAEEKTTTTTTSTTILYEEPQPTFLDAVNLQECVLPEQYHQIQESHNDIYNNNIKTKTDDTATSKTRFWKEGEATLMTAFIPAALPRHEIMACAMTG
jgi:hypothetical protein